jgi:hypothetical protein
MKMDRTLTGLRTDSKSAPGVCVSLTSAKSIASTVMGGTGDGLQPPITSQTETSAPADARSLPERVSMSYQAIAAALALEDLSVGERLTAFSLASFANRQHRAWPSASTAAGRAGLSRRQYLAARGELERRGLITREGNERRHTAALIYLAFADHGPSIDHEINAELFETTLARSHSRGGARVLLAVLAALADPEETIDGVSAEELKEAGGLSDRTYRRARARLLADGEIGIDEAGGGRARCNRWHVIRFSDQRSPAQIAAAAIPAPEIEHGPQPAPTENPVTNPGANPGQNRTPPFLKTPAQTPAETPAPRARAGREPQNQRATPPDPPEGGQPGHVVIVEDFVSSRGRRRQRQVFADPTAELSSISAVDRDAWCACRELLRQMVGDSMFEIWLADLDLIAISRIDRALLISGRAETLLWVDRRYGRLLASLAHGGRLVRVASDRERQLHAAALANRSSPPQPAASLSPRPDQQEVI